MADAKGLRADMTFKMAILTPLGGDAGLAAGQPRACRAAQRRLDCAQRTMSLAEPRAPGHFHAALEQRQRGDAADVEARRQILMVLGETGVRLQLQVANQTAKI